MTRVATVLILASPWVLLLGGLAIVGGTLPWWALALYLGTATLSSLVLVGLCRASADPQRWDCPDEVDS